ncbi:uncharacterized protein LOC112637217 [Camponotus floridanus]|uniref:uncharacterized protein LOC112637217 n=1 Tax=Camponotus floridanus TaxID=104421 RepID=UPI000DC6909B|nr:uncharacterized protein LOC112637217 [Camponotus floridanus]
MIGCGWQYWQNKERGRREGEIEQAANFDYKVTRQGDTSNHKHGSCRECGERHNTLCHMRGQTFNPPAGPTRSTTENPGAAAAGVTLCSVTNTVRGSATGDIKSADHHTRVECERGRVLMATAIVNVKTSIGESQLRVLLDSASELNFITAAACKKLNIKLENDRENISGLNGMSCLITHGCKISLKSRASDFNLNAYCLVVPNITKKLPSFTVEVSKLRFKIPDNLKLADPLYFNPGHIDALIGSEFFFQLLDNGKIELGDDLLALQNTKFGWIISGPVPQHLIVSRTPNRQLSSNHTCLFAQQSFDETMKLFWELEEYKSKNTRLSKEKQCCEIHFVNTTTRDASSGRFVVRLPFRENKQQLGRSRDIAMKRFNHLERKFRINTQFRDEYVEFMSEYIALGHMSVVDEDDGVSSPIYLLHHGVIREASITIKLRVIFDASAKTTSGFSLNDTLMIGSNLQDNIIDILMRFRLPAIAMTADLQKMYRQIWVHLVDRNYQRILWRFSPNDPIREYNLNTVTYGQACAPFLVIHCVRQLAEEGASEFSDASKALLNDLYVDDIITGVNCEEKAINLISQLELLLGRGGFKAYKWRTNSKKVMKKLRAIDQIGESSALAIEASTMRTLGLNWCPKTDVFQFSIDVMISQFRRSLELIMQETWISNLGWDEPLTENLRQAWDTYVEDLQGIGAIRVPRRIIQCPNAVRFNLHAFCDASLRAYGACIYFQAVDESNNSSSFLICSKSRVAPVKSKTITLPRLELCGAIVLIRLVQNVKRVLKIAFDEVHA